MKTVIGITGVKTSGKSTVASMIKNIFPNAAEVAIADKLKNVCTEAFGLTRDCFDNQDLKEVPFSDGPKFFNEKTLDLILNRFDIVLKSHVFQALLEKFTTMPLPTPRKIAQVVGTELLREYGHPDIHCEQVELSDGVNVVSDIRFPNEFEYFSNSVNVNFLPIYINRKQSEDLIMDDSHPSETSVFLFNDRCHRINNNGTLEETQEQVLNLLRNELLLKSERLNNG